MTEPRSRTEPPACAPGCVVDASGEWRTVIHVGHAVANQPASPMLMVCTNGKMGAKNFEEPFPTPLLPDPSTLTPSVAEQAWDSHCTGEADSGPGRIWQLEDGYMTLHSKDGGPTYPVYWLWNDCEFGSGYVTPTNREAHGRDMQKYGAAVEWWTRRGSQLGTEGAGG